VEIVAEHNPPTDSDVDEDVFGKLICLAGLAGTPRFVPAFREVTNAPVV
jgi:hypothetical protein